MDDRNNKPLDGVQLPFATAAANTASSEKKCSVCGSAKSINEYYKKGKRYDSACKSCQKSKKRTGYSIEKNSDAIANVQMMIELMGECFVNQVNAEIERLDKEIQCRTKKKL